MGHNRLACKDLRFDIEFIVSIPHGFFQIDKRRDIDAAAANAVYQDVYLAEGVHRFLHGLNDLCIVGDIGL